MEELKSEVILDGLVFPEGPRWHDGKLWFSDQHSHKVHTVDENGQSAVVVELDDRPSGLGFLPDGRLLIAATHSRKLLRLDPDGLYELADLKEYAEEFINDMVTDAQGRSYIGARDMAMGSTRGGGRIVLVTPDGRAEVATEETDLPNGTVITQDGKTLIVAETGGHRLTAFDVDLADGSLRNRRPYATLDKSKFPDGICLDAEGGVWLGSPLTNEFLRVLEGGEVTHRIHYDDGKWAIACALGGADRRTLFLLTAYCSLENLRRLSETSDDSSSESVGFIETMRVDVPGAGIP
jgi:sugar lactone lactonase YvrE